MTLRNTRLSIGLAVATLVFGPFAASSATADSGRRRHRPAREVRRYRTVRHSRPRRRPVRYVRRHSYSYRSVPRRVYHSRPRDYHRSRGPRIGFSFRFTRDRGRGIRHDRRPTHFRRGRGLHRRGWR
jgi:hypothetical protein